MKNKLMDIKIASEKGEEIARIYNPEGLTPFPFEKVQEGRSDLLITLLDLDEKISGAILFKDEKFTVLANIKKPKTRQYFTIAHELGHYFLHAEVIKEKQVIIDGENSLDNSSILFRLDDCDPTQLEIEANNFAASLIMPEHLVKNAWKIARSVEECAKIFKVSIAAMSIRLQKLGLVE